MKQCFFIGHSDAPVQIFSALCESVYRCIEQDPIQTFVVGHYGRFDQMAAKAVTKAKDRNPHIELIMLLPYHPADKKVIIPSCFDGTFYPFEKVPPAKTAIIKANQYMIDHSDVLIACSSHVGNTKKFVEYAQRRKEQIRIENLAEL